MTTGTLNGHCHHATPTADIDQIARTLRLFVPPRQIGEIRVIGHGTYGYYFDHEEIHQAAEIAARESRTAKAVYVVMNRLAESLRDRARLARTTDLTKNTDIDRRTWLLIDFDPVRAVEASSTDDEKEAARELREVVFDWLRDRGFPEPIVCDSSNGWHLLYNIDLPNDEVAAKLVQAFLKSLAARFSTDQVGIDIGVHNASRITKLYGIVSRKGEDTSDRPHRVSSVIYQPDEMYEVRRELLQGVVDEGKNSGLFTNRITDIETADQPITGKLILPEVFPVGGRHANLLSAAGFMRSRGYCEIEILEGLQTLNRTRCGGAKPDSELRAIARDFAVKDVNLGLAALLAGESDSAVETAQRQQQVKNSLLVAQRRISEGRSIDEVLVPIQKMMLEVQGATQAEPFSLDLIDSSTFFSRDYRQHFLIKRVMIAGQPMMLGGQSKTLKTTIALDATVSLGTGTDFLGAFPVTEAVRVGIISAESGMYTLQRNARVIAQARDVVPQDINCFWGDKLPKICKPDHLEALRTTIIKQELKVVFLDPAYLMILSGDEQGRNAGNVFDMGSILIGLTDISRDTGCTIILIHHNRKNKEDPFSPPDLADMAFSGFAEWARQWLLIGRREKYEHGTGIHRLWLNIGGSVGHGSLWSADINEGVIDDNLEGRCWDVSVQAPHEAKQEAQASKEATKRQAEHATVIEHATCTLKYLSKFPEGRTIKDIREACGLNTTAMTRALDSLRESDEITDCEVKKTNGQTYTGVRKTNSLEHRN